MLSCEWGRRGAGGGINFCFLGGRNLVIGEVTPHQLSHHCCHDCSLIEFLRALSHGKGRVQNLNSNPEVCHTNILMPESQVALVETSSIGHPPHSSASPVELRLRVGPRALSGKKKNLGNRV